MFSFRPESSAIRSPYAFLGQDLGDTSNLENPEVLSEIAQLGGKKNA